MYQYIYINNFKFYITLNNNFVMKVVLEHNIEKQVDATCDGRHPVHNIPDTKTNSVSGERFMADIYSTYDNRQFQEEQRLQLLSNTKTI